MGEEGRLVIGLMMDSIVAGIDHVELAEFRDEIEGNPSLEASLFTQNELAEAVNRDNRLQRLAGRFAAKEAILKGLKTGWTDSVEFTEIEVSNSQTGVPLVVLRGKTKALASQLGVINIEVSISHTSNVAMAIAILTIAPPQRSSE
jgi:holo-[acyl-carrier protein] synthase